MSSRGGSWTLVTCWGYGTGMNILVPCQRLTRWGVAVYGQHESWVQKGSHILKVSMWRQKES